MITFSIRKTVEHHLTDHAKPGQIQVSLKNILVSCSFSLFKKQPHRPIWRRWRRDRGGAWRWEWCRRGQWHTLNCEAADSLMTDDEEWSRRCSDEMSWEPSLRASPASASVILLLWLTMVKHIHQLKLFLVLESMEMTACKYSTLWLLNWFT